MYLFCLLKYCVKCGSSNTDWQIIVSIGVEFSALKCSAELKRLLESGAVIYIDECVGQL